MRRALIGHTGFVGGNLAAQTSFTDFYNSKNIESLAGEGFDLVVCAGAPAVKWLANKEPAADRAAIERLQKPLLDCQAKQLILVSTVDVYPRPIDVDEDTKLDPATQQPYGKHRFLLEEAVLAKHPGAVVVRLPALFGPGLKKNVVYDFLHGNRVEAIESEAAFQWYDLAELWNDLQRAQSLGVPRVNLATEPFKTSLLAKEAFGLEFENRLSTPPPRYDYHSKYAPAWGGVKYQYDAANILSRLKAFVRGEQARLSA